MLCFPMPEQCVQKIGENFVNINSITSSVTTVVAPANNQNGMIVRSVHVATSGTVNGSLFVSSTAPSSLTDTTKRALLFNWNSGSKDIVWPFQFYVEPGEGIYVVGGGSGDRLSITYDLLD